MRGEPEDGPVSLLSTDAAAIPAGIGVYRLLREIGRGGTGVVYEAERADGQFRRRVALKIIHVAGDAALQQRVHAERQILAALEHPHIARLLDGGVADDGRPFLVMELVDGTPVDAYCDRMRLTVVERLRLFVDIARAVDFAHRNLIVHRDLKPSNVLVRHDGSVRLVDFGVARLLNPVLGGAAAATRDPAALTLEYASPEQVRGDALSTATDVYSLGVVLYELLCGRRPFAHLEADTPALLRAIEDAVPARPSARVLRAETLRADGRDLAVTPETVARARGTTPRALARQLRGDCDAIVAMALRPEPLRRYSSAELLAQDVERCLGQRPVHARRGSRTYAVGKLIRRHRWQVVATLLAAASLLGGTAGAAWQTAIARRERNRAVAALAQARQVTEFMAHLFDAGHDAGAVNADITARDLVRVGAAHIDELTGEPLLQARLLGVLGRIHEAIGQYEDGQRLTQRALDIRHDVRATGDATEAGLLLQLGVLQRRRVRYDSAQLSFQRAQEILHRLPEPSHELLASTLQELLGIAVYRADNAEAVRRSDEAVALLRRLRGEHDRLTVNALRSLGTSYWRLGDYAAAEATLRRTIELRPLAAGSTRKEVREDALQLAELLRTMARDDEAEKIYIDVGRGLQPDVPDNIGALIWSLNGRSGIAEKRGDIEQALRLRLEFFALRETTMGADHPHVAAVRAGIAVTFARLERFDEAEQWLNHGRQDIVAQFGENSPPYAALLVEMASVRFYQRRHAEADTLIARALQLHRELGLPRAIPYIERLMLRAEIQLALGGYALAEQLLHEALEVTRRVVLENARPTREIHLLYERLYRAWGRPEEAERHGRWAEAARRS